MLSVYTPKKRYNIHDAFINGFTSVFAIFPSQKVVKLQTADDDRRAIASDWMAVGRVIRHAMINYKTIDE